MFKNNAPNNSGLVLGSRFCAAKPKRTLYLLLSNDGLGHILLHFPRVFKYRGRGHEVGDLGNLLCLYAEWHSRLLPYFLFDQFVHKVEQIGTKNLVKKCIRELRERVANGVDPAKLHEPQVQDDIPNLEEDATNLEDQNPFHKNTPIENNTYVQNPDTHNLQENAINEIWEMAMVEPSQPSDDKIVQADAPHGEKETPRMAPENASSSSSGIVISEGQRARTEANRLKALEKAAARARNL